MHQRTILSYFLRGRCYLSTAVYYYRLVADIWSTSAPPRNISPRGMVQSIKRVGKQFRPMRQEDAHEYLRQLLDCMHEEVLKAHGIKLSDGKIAETTVISRVFGGYLCNELRCGECKYSSKTYNHFQDLSLEVTGGVNSVHTALKTFLKVEKLTSGNEWKCDGCNKKVQAFKQMSICKAPNVLVLHLKRFSFGNFMAKITKPIQFELFIEIPCSGEAKGTAQYDLIGIVVHHGHSSHSGHYVAFVKVSEFSFMITVLDVWR
jgi:ubiquitin carboxyl-terminal hydrolase 36/42